jgi:hypothetical protein
MGVTTCQLLEFNQGTDNTITMVVKITPDEDGVNLENFTYSAQPDYSIIVNTEVIQSPSTGTETARFTLTVQFPYNPSPSSKFYDLYVNGHLVTYDILYDGLSVTGGIGYQYSYLTPTLTVTSFSTGLDTDTTYVITSFSYTYTGFVPDSTYFSYILNVATTPVTISSVSWTLYNSGGSGSGTARFLTTAGQLAPLFGQAATITHQLYYSYSDHLIGPFYYPTSYSGINTFYTIPFDSSNIETKKSVITITISTTSKTAMLPPVTTCVGTLFHFKILNMSYPYTFRICQHLNSPVTYPLQTYLYTGSPSFDSLIENDPSPYVFNSTSIRNTLTLVSDGTNWLIINKYMDTNSGITLSSATLPEPHLTEVTETSSFKYNYVDSGSYNNILIHPISYSYLKYIFISNSDTSIVTFNIYVPSGSGLETIDAEAGKCLSLSFSLAAGEIAGLILTYSGDRYYIISASVNLSITTEGTFSNDSSLVSNIVSRLVTGNYFQLPYVPTLDSSHSCLFILKSGNVTSQHIKGQTANVIFQTTAVTPSLAFSITTDVAIWFIVTYDQGRGREIYLPICYYSSS